VAYGERNDPVTATAAVVGGNVVGGLLQGQSARDAASTTADAQLKAAQIAADSAKFRPVGMTTGFGSSNFTMNPDGTVKSAGYSLNQPTQSMFNGIQGMNQGALQNYQNAGQDNQGLAQGAQSAMALGNQYLQQSPQEVAAKYMSDQNKLLQPQNDQNLANAQNSMFNNGREGLAVGMGGGQANANPEMNAYYNALNMQQNQLASQATAAGQSNAQFGQSMVNQGGALQNSYYNNLSAAGNPLQNQMAQMNTIDQTGQQSLSLGMGLGNTQAAAGALSGGMLQRGVAAAAPYQYAAGSYNPFATALGGASNGLATYGMMGGFNNSPSQQTNPYAAQLAGTGPAGGGFS
jgi:hypothetical protein